MRVLNSVGFVAKPLEAKAQPPANKVRSLLAFTLIQTDSRTFAAVVVLPATTARPTQPSTQKIQRLIALSTAAIRRTPCAKAARTWETYVGNSLRRGNPLGPN
jgi:hypothetical protein